MRSDLSAVVFDLGGVLIDWDPGYVYRELIPDPTEREWFFEAVCSPEWNRAMDAGKGRDESIAELVAQFPDQKERIEAWRDRWAEMLGGVIEGTLEVAGLLEDSGVPLYALTNWSADTWPIALEQFDFLHTLFEGIVVSGQEKVAKPDTAVFRILLDRYDLEAQTTGFVDDNQTNVEAATSVGLVAHHFTSSDNLRRWLVPR